MAALVADRHLDAATVVAIHRTTEGNPLFIVETVRAGPITATGVGFAPDPPVTPKVQAVIRARLAQLSQPARELAGLAAVMGRSFAYDELALASDWDEDTVVHGLDELWRRRIIREQGLGAYDFSHDKIRDVAYAEMSHAWAEPVPSAGGPSPGSIACSRSGPGLRLYSRPIMNGQAWRSRPSLTIAWRLR